jgi:tetratricopeptide (TPR) repeat protein
LIWFDPERALAVGDEGLRIARELAGRPIAGSDDQELLALIMVDMVMLLINEGRLEDAREYGTEAKALFEQIGNLPMAATATQRLGVVHRSQGNYERAAEVMDEAALLDESIGNEAGILYNSIGLLELLPELGEFAGVLDLIERVRPIVDRQGMLPSQLYKLHPIVVYYHLGAWNLVLEQEALIRDFAATGTQLWPNVYVCVAAMAEIRRGNVEAADKWMDLLHGAQGLGNVLVPESTAIPEARAEYALATGALDEAIGYVDRLLQRTQGMGILHRVPAFLLLKSRIQHAAGSEQESYATLLEAHELATMQGSRNALWQICARLAPIEEARGNAARAAALRDEARTAIDYIAAHAGRDDLRAAFLARPAVQAIAGHQPAGRTP